MTVPGGSRLSDGYSRSHSPDHPLVPRLSLQESISAPQSSPRAPMSPRAPGPSSPNHQSSRARQGLTPDQKKGSPRFGGDGFGTPRDSARDSVRSSARDSARLESARRRNRESESFNAHVMRRRNCTSTGQRSSVGKRPNPLLSGNSKGTPSSVRRSPRVASPEDEGGAGSTNCSVSGARVSSPSSTPVRGTGTKHRRASENQMDDVVRAMVYSLSSDGDGGHMASQSQVEADEVDIITEVSYTPVYPTVEIPVIACSAVQRSSADPRTSVDPVTARSESGSSSSSGPPSPSPIAPPAQDLTVRIEEPPPGQGFRFGHKKTPSFRCIPGEGVDNLTAPLDNGALPSARTMSSPVPQSIDEHDYCYSDFQFEDDYDSSTACRVEALNERVQNLVQEMSAYVTTPPVPPPSAGARAAGMGPGRPPRPPCLMGSLSGPPGHIESEDELSRLKFRISHLELSLKRAGEDSRGQPDGCCNEMHSLRRQLAETQGQLVDAREEIQEAKGQINALAQRLNMLPSNSSTRGNSLDTSRSLSAPTHLLTPRLTPSATVVAVGTPVHSARRDMQPGVALDVALAALSARNYGNTEVKAVPLMSSDSAATVSNRQVVPLTPSDSVATVSPMPTVPVQRQTSIPQDTIAIPGTPSATSFVPASATASPMTSARIQRRPSSPPPQAPSHLSLVPSSGSFTPQQPVFVGAPCQNAQASPLRAQHLPSHMQSAPCIANTPPASARMVAAQKEELLARGVQFQYQPAIQSARSTPTRSKMAAIPGHVSRAPCRIAG